ncbi:MULTISPECIES: hypothetical protein [unclassified Nostoc]|uniref:hypothetical protein n=1 Tax=unclassified Nostoc TaxID=2593658 RepID=UPI002AD304CF|nr:MULTISPECIES: hypothetical protein [unclassified Nostoc]MDZ8122171.1 hypothetical protein [Nostoc sp. CmiVER01]MDZ8225763.1 hypothetical protein [Nostoc sp. ChiVER01]
MSNYLLSRLLLGFLSSDIEQVKMCGLPPNLTMDILNSDLEQVDLITHFLGLRRSKQ